MAFPLLRVICGFLPFLSVSPVTAVDFFVSPMGSDSNAGTEIAPWKTFQKAASTAPPGSTVFLREGIYPEKVVIEVSGNAVDGPVIFKSYPGEEAILDGTGLPFDPDNSNALIAIIDQNYVHIEDLTLRNLKTAGRYLVPIGILIEGSSHHIDILGNVIHGIETQYNGLDGGDAHGIGVFGYDTDPIHDILISENELFALKLGSSEALVLNGNVTDFEVSHNVVRDCNNIGIDFIGFEGNGPTPALDQARDGVCRGNLVFNINSSFNPAYGGSFTRGGGDTGADGIYVDGGTRILIEQNVVHHCNIGIELASEHAGRATSEITVRDNLVYQNHIGGIFLGGYDSRRGMTRNCHVLNNTLFENDTNQDGNGEIYLQFDVANCSIRNNLLQTNGQGLLFGNPYTQNSGNSVDYQLFFSPNGAQEWQWKRTYFTSLSVYRNGSGNDANSSLVTPDFVDAARFDFRPLTSSAARNGGDPAFVTAPGETDLAGLPRVSESRVDIGAFEYRATAPDVIPAITGAGMTISNGDTTPSPDDGTDLGEVDWRDGLAIADFVITNSGTETFRPVGFDLESATPGAFRFLRLFSRIPPGGSGTVRVLFDPATAGTQSAELLIFGAFASSNLLTFTVQGTGLVPDQLPDALAGISPSTLRGNDQYNVSGAGQTVSLRFTRKKTLARYRIENDGALTDTIGVTGSRGNRFLQISYFRTGESGRRNVSGPAFSGAESQLFDSGSGQNYECRIRKSRRGRERKFKTPLAMTARSAALPQAVDRAAVRLLAK